MPVEKFSSFTQAEEALWCMRPDAEYYTRLRGFWRVVEGLSHPGRRYPHGVTGYRTTDEAARQMDEWLLSSPENPARDSRSP